MSSTSLSSKRVAIRTFCGADSVQAFTEMLLGADALLAADSMNFTADDQTFKSLASSELSLLLEES